MKNEFSEIVSLTSVRNRKSFLDHIYLKNDKVYIENMLKKIFDIYNRYGNIFVDYYDDSIDMCNLDMIEYVNNIEQYNVSVGKNYILFTHKDTQQKIKYIFKAEDPELCKKYIDNHLVDVYGNDGTDNCIFVHSVIKIVEYLKPILKKKILIKKICRKYLIENVACVINKFII